MFPSLSAVQTIVGRLFCEISVFFLVLFQLSFGKYHFCDICCKVQNSIHFSFVIEERFVGKIINKCLELARFFQEKLRLLLQNRFFQFRKYSLKYL